MQLSSWVMGPAPALFPGHLPLCFFWPHTWPLNHPKKREKAWYNSYIIKPQDKLDHDTCGFGFRQCACAFSLSQQCARTFWPFAYLASTNNTSSPQMSRFVVYSTPVAYTETETNASLHKYQFTLQAVPQRWTCRRHIRRWLRLSLGTAAVNCSGAIREGWGPHICRCPQSNSYITK